MVWRLYARSANTDPIQKDVSGLWTFPNKISGEGLHRAIYGPSIPPRPFWQNAAHIQ